MIGFVSFRFKGTVPARAILEDDGTWSCSEAPSVAAALNARFPLRAETGSAAGLSGAELVHAAARKLAGTPEIVPPQS